MECFKVNDYCFEVDFHNGKLHSMSVKDVQFTPSYEPLTVQAQGVKLHLEKYFSGSNEACTFPLSLEKGTPFQQKIWNLLLDIPYGQTTTYTALALKYGDIKAIRAVGRAVGQNPLVILVPCHRVLGKNGDLTGFAYGLNMKKELLQIEGVIQKELTLF